MADRVLRVGVLGQGRSGFDIHCAWLRKDPEKFRIVAAADLLPERRAQAEAELGAKAFRDYRTLLADRSLALDLVVNALPSHLHPPATIEALDAGHNVVCEKPLARTVKDFDRMVAAARRNRRTLLPFQNSRFMPAFRKIQEVIASGKLGRIVHIRLSYSGFARRWDWQTCQELWGGNLLNTGPHPMDHAVVLFGERRPKVSAKLLSDNPYGDAENFALVTLTGKDAPTIEVAVSSFLAYPQGDTFSVNGTLGGLAGGASALRWKYFDPAKAPSHPKFHGQWSDKRQYCHEELPWIEEQWQNDPSDVFAQTSPAYYGNVYDILVNGAPRVITLEQVRRQMAVMEEAHRQNPMPRMQRRFVKRGGRS
jgi:predicted dehydrogenase